MESSLAFIIHHLCQCWLHQVHKRQAHRPQCQPQPLSLPPPLNITLTIQWPGAHTNIPIVTLFTLEKRMGTWYSYSLIINRSLRTVGNRWKNKMLWSLNLALTCEQEQALRSWASCQGGLDTSCRCFDACLVLYSKDKTYLLEPASPALPLPLKGDSQTLSSH